MTFFFIFFSLNFRVNYLEIYNEKVYDLLNDRKEIKIQEFPNGELKFGCTGRKVQHEDDILLLVDAGNNYRKVAETNMNVQSSRSHAILQVVSRNTINSIEFCLTKALNRLTFFSVRVSSPFWNAMVHHK